MIDLYSTCPRVGDGATTAEFGEDIRNVARWSESAGLRGTLVFTDNEYVDPWATAQFMIECTTDLVPLVAVQPVYMHPYTVARTVSTVASLYGRRIDLNMVTGGFRPHLKALDGFVGHDDRYDRLVEYTEIITALHAGEQPTTYAGEHYKVAEAELFPPLPTGFDPRIFVSGNSPAAMDTAEKLGVDRLTYPRAVAEYENDPSSLRKCGIRAGVIARETSGEAWRVARGRYPDSPFAERLHQVAAAKFEAQWHRSLWSDSQRPHDVEDAYWLHPFRVSREFCPYLVGSYQEVGELLARYLRLGVTTLIFSTPVEEDDLVHAVRAVRCAENLCSAPMPG